MGNLERARGGLVKNIYRDALINIWKRRGKSWDGDRLCHDPQHVARLAIKKVDPELHDLLDVMPYEKVKVFKNGKVKFPKKGK